MKVAIDARLVGGTSTGDSTYWTCFLSAFVERFPEVELVCISNQKRPENVPALQNVSWVEVHARSNRWWSMVTFPIAARKLGATITHGQYGISPLCKNGISTVHDVSFMVNSSWFSKRDFSLLKAGVGLSAKTAKKLITVSETSREEIERFFPAAARKTRVAYNAAPDWIQKSSAEKIAAVREKFGIQGPYLLTVGTNWARKNMKLAVDAARRAEARLVVTGKQGAELSCANVIPTGYVDTETLSALYTGATIYLAPSLHEGFGIPICEAMRCGAPVLCGVGGAMPEVAGTAALIMPDYDIDTWATAIDKLLHDPSKLKDLSERGTEHEKVFSWERSAKAHYDVYREVN